MEKGIRVTTGAPWSTSVEVDGLRVTCARFAAGYAIPSHFHDLACLSVIVEGGFLQAFPGVDYECPPGAVLVKPPGERHTDRWGTMRSAHLMVEPTMLEDSEDLVARVFRDVRFTLDPRAIWLSRRIYDEVAQQDDLSPLSIEALALELVVLAGRGSTRRTHGSAPSWLPRARECLADDATGGMRIGEVAAQVGVHPSRLAREFRRCFGLTPGEYVRRLRVERARGDLDRGTEPLSAIALRHGFADQSHFTREFRRVTGVTPAAYRRGRRSRQ